MGYVRCASSDGMFNTIILLVGGVARGVCLLFTPIKGLPNGTLSDKNLVLFSDKNNCPFRQGQRAVRTVLCLGLMGIAMLWRARCIRIPTHATITSFHALFPLLIQMIKLLVLLVINQMESLFYPFLYTTHTDVSGSACDSCLFY